MPPFIKRLTFASGCMRHLSSGLTALLVVRGKKFLSENAEVKSKFKYEQGSIPKERGGIKMRAPRRKRVVMSVVGIFMIMVSLSLASAEEYDAMNGVDSVNVFFDMRDAIPMIADVHLALILDTYNELVAMKKKPDFVVVFMGGPSS